MIVVVMKCGMCGNRFKIELLNREDPNERHVRGQAPRCPNCGSPRVEIVDKLRRAS
jgi:DNA-directed RNA polymerase subunit RPC12/RpoP